MASGIPSLLHPHVPSLWSAHLLAYLQPLELQRRASPLPSAVSGGPAMVPPLGLLWTSGRAIAEHPFSVQNSAFGAGTEHSIIGRNLQLGSWSRHVNKGVTCKKKTAPCLVSAASQMVPTPQAF